MSNTMKAVRIHAYGGREQLEVEQAPIPRIQADEVLVKIHAAAVNPVDWKVREGMVAGMLNHKLPLVPGWDFAGEIAAVGEAVTSWKVGDAVFARPDIARDGAYAEYIAVKATEIAPKPASLNWQQAAAVPLASLTAWQALYEKAGLKEGDRVLIHAGSGGVGSIAIQLAKLRGAYVYTTTSTRNVEWVKSLGADEVIDYTQEDFSTLRDLDVVFDTLGGEVQQKSLSTLRAGGCIVSIISPVDEEKAQEFKVRAEYWFVQPNGEQLRQIAGLFDEGRLKIGIDSVFTLDQIAEAHEKSEGHHTRGKIVLQVA